MKVVGNCPSCGNPIYGDPSVQSVKRTCYCAMPARTAPITVQPILPYVQPLQWPYQPYVWSTTSVTPQQATANSITITAHTKADAIVSPRPPDEDGALVS